MKDSRIKTTVGYRYPMDEYPGEVQRRIMVGIPMTGTLRSEWVLARYGQVIPCNWSQMDHIEWVDQFSPIRFSVSDARNLIVDDCVRRKFEWLIFVDHDVVLHPLFLVTVNKYIISKKYPIFGGLYFTKSVPSEPLVYRGRGNGYYDKWKMGDQVMVDGMGMGATVISGKVLKAVWDISPEIAVHGRKVRRVFETPQRVKYDPKNGTIDVQTGTEDLDFLGRIINHGILAKAGWPELAKKKYPFLIDTALFCRHISPDGIQYPAREEEKQFMKKK